MFCTAGLGTIGRVLTFEVEDFHVGDHWSQDRNTINFWILTIAIDFFSLQQ